MKKIISVFMTALVLCATFFALNCNILSVSAASDSCYINGDFESLEYNKTKYIPLDENEIYCSGEEYYHLAEKYNDKDIEEQYSSVELYLYYECDYVIFADLESQNGRQIQKIFVAESRYSELQSFASSESNYGYETYSYYGDEFALTDSVTNNWINNSEKITDYSNKYSSFEQYDVVSVSSDGYFSKDFGLIIREPTFGGESDKYYLLRYSEYDNSYFYANGYFAMNEKNLEVTLYVLEDAALANELSAFYDEEPEDDLGWVFDSQLSNGVFFVITLVIFGFIPLGAIILSVVFLFKKRPKNPYFASLIVLAAAAMTVLIGYVVMVILLI